MSIQDIIISIIIGALSGWIASIIMNSKSSLIRNIIIGIIGGFVGTFILGLFGINGSGYLGAIIVSTIGSCLLIFVASKLLK